MLANLKGVDTSGSDGKWYDPAMKWALDNGVTDKADGAENVTRQEIAAMLWHALGEPAATGSLAGYADAGLADSACVEALKWAVGVGVIQGKSDTVLDPTGNLIRAELAQIFYNYLTLAQ